MGIFSIFPAMYNYMFAEDLVKKPNLGEDLRLLVQSSEFEKQLNSATPFLAISLIAWPSYWLYRGLVWNFKRDVQPLPLFIKKTFFRAKTMQFAILLTGTLMAINANHKSCTRQIEVQNLVQKK